MTTIDTLKTLWARTVREGDFSVVVIDVVEREGRLFATLQHLEEAAVVARAQNETPTPKA